MGMPVIIVSLKKKSLKYTVSEIFDGTKEDALKYADSLFQAGKYEEVSVFESRCLARFGPVENRPLRYHPEHHEYDKGTPK